jgi:hypothetical protein
MDTTTTTDNRRKRSITIHDSLWHRAKAASATLPDCPRTGGDVSWYISRLIRQATK